MGKQIKTLAREWSKDADVLLAELKQANLVPSDATIRKVVEEDEMKEGLARAAEVKTDGRPTVADLISEFKEKGLSDLSVARLDLVLPQLKGKSPTLKESKRLNEAQLELAHAMLTPLTAIARFLLKDTTALEGWKPPSAAQLTTEGALFTYTGICGHEVQMSRGLLDHRFRFWNEGDSRQSIALRLCSKCRTARVNVMARLPGVATSDSVCSFCQGTIFSGEDKALSLMASRGDIWENLISGMLNVYRLPGRLTPLHGPDHPTHKEIQRRNRKKFEEWVATFRAEIASVVSAHPERGAEIHRRMEATIQSKLTELGLEKGN